MSSATGKVAGVIFLAAVLLGAYFALTRYSESETTVHWNSTCQVIDGFGASSAGDVMELPASLMDFFYSTKNSGIGLDFIRLKIYPDFADCEGDEGKGNCVQVAGGPTLSTWDLNNARAAVTRGAKVVAAEWSPPGIMKTSGLYQGGGALIGNTSNYTSLASIQTAFVRLLDAQYQIQIYAISPQNEPDVIQPYPTCAWTAQQFHDYVPYLAKALSDSGYSDVKIMLSEKGTWGNSYDTAAMDDPAVAKEIAILAEHAYASTPSRLGWKNLTTQHVWETEVSDFDQYDGSMTSALFYATEIHNWLTIPQVNAWFWWALADDQGEGHNCCLTDAKGDIPKRAYAIGNWSRFVRPGWQRIGVTGHSSLLVTAFKGPENQFAIVAVNKSPWPAFRQTFGFDGVNVQSQITPWLTSANASLAQQPTITSISNGSSFRYSVPGRSVVTLVGRGE